MVLQARAEATRRRIIDSAVELFDERGYGETGLADILQRAGVSKGAFYYHFDSKEAVASAVIGEYQRRNTERVLDAIDRTAPLLERIIIASFASADMINSEKIAQIGNQLLQALGQVSSVAPRVYSEWTTEFVDNLAKAIQQVGPRDGVDTSEVAEAMWAAVLGCHLMSSALDREPRQRLARVWRCMLRATIAEPAQAHYNALLDHLASERQSVG